MLRQRCIFIHFPLLFNIDAGGLDGYGLDGWSVHGVAAAWSDGGVLAALSNSALLPHDTHVARRRQVFSLYL